MTSRIGRAARRSGGFLTSLLDGAPGNPRPLHRVLGVAGLVVAALVLLVAGVVYAVPFGERTYVAEFAETGGVTPGDDVRIAGITVGEVQSAELSGAHIDVEFGVSRDVDMGGDTRAEIKMLTPIGGRYIHLADTETGGDLADGGQGAGRIPLDRTRVPYELAEVFDSATEVSGEVDGQALSDMLGAVDAGFHGGAERMPRLVGQVRGLAEAAAEQEENLREGRAVAREYTDTFARRRDDLAAAVSQLAAVSTSLGDNREDIVRAFEGLKRFLYQAKRPLLAYEDQVEPVLDDLAGIVGYLDEHQDEFLGAVGDMDALADELVATARGAGLDVPDPGSTDAPCPPGGCPR